MKKSLLALAVLSAFAGAASAQTNVSIYGLVDVAVTRSDTNAAGVTGEPVWSLDGGNFTKNGSRIGFKGSEDLGGGLSAIFTLENGFTADDGRLGQGGRLFGRQAFVGLQGGFGAVKFGRQYTPMHIALDTIDPFGTGMAGNIAGLSGDNINSPMFNNNGVRTDNTINYSLTAAGLNAQIAYSLGEVAGDNSAGRQIGLGLGYANGPINVQFAYHDSNANPSATPPVANDVKTTLLGGTFNLGVAKLHAGFQTNKADVAATGVTAIKDRNWMLGASAPVGAGEVRATFVRSDDRLAANTDSDLYALGYVHNLSKRSNVYTAYGRVSNKTTPDANLFQVGVQHKF